MSSVAFVTSNQVVRINEQDYAECLQSAQVPCEDTITQGTAWAVPVVSAAGLLAGYDMVISATKPQSDAINTVRVWNKTRKITWFLAIGDSDTEAAFVDKCNACCGATPVMDTVTIPSPLVEDCPCADSDGNYTWLFPFPTNDIPLDYLLTGFTFNGATPPTPAAGGYASKAAVLTFVQTAVTGWAAYGTWSLEGDNDEYLKLVSTSTECAGGDITLEEASYCFEIPAASTEVNGIKIGATPVNTEFPNITFDDTTAANRQTVIDAIRPYLIGDLEVVEDTGTYFVKYTGIQEPVTLTLDGVDVAATAFSTGACP